jgi:hypothetical protein
MWLTHGFGGSYRRYFIDGDNMISVDLGIRKFRSRDAARRFFQDMLHSYANGDRVSAAHAQLLTELIKRHPEYRIKLGAGISHFQVDGADFASQCFYVHRLDGTHEDFSLHACIDEA